ncbi:precorrin-3B synthase [Ochrobactrum quorumnocens]|nr:precorrin-3B synthase [[Ochrobactrum] quorumnocens]MBD7989966.1 precorrin-3B synthase [Ochrobactrum gallinarum]
MLSQQTAPTVPLRADRRNACPGLSRMVMAKDGAIARVKLPLGRINATEARSLAEIAKEFGNGTIELSIRSNIQIRGIAPSNWDKAITALYDAGFGADNPSADDIRNVMVSPTASIDRTQLADTSRLATSLLKMLEGTEKYHALSPKFSFQIDGGEDCAMISHTGDIWLSSLEGGAHYAVGLASSPDTPPVGTVAQAEALSLIEALLDLFQSLAATGVTRMKHLFETLPQEQFLRELPFELSPAPTWKRKPPKPFSWLGTHSQKGGHFYAGAMPLLGRLQTEQLHKLAQLAESANGGEIRLTPWQGVLLPNIEQADCNRITTTLDELGLATLPEAPQARLRACSGSAGCASALADTLTDAERLAGMLIAGNKQVHITGCAKSCAALSPLPHTLLARSDDHYDLFSQDSAGPLRFGQLLASNITIDEAAFILNARNL